VAILKVPLKKLKNHYLIVRLMWAICNGSRRARVGESMLMGAGNRSSMQDELIDFDTVASLRAIDA